MKLYDLIAPYYDEIIDQTLHALYVERVKHYVKKGHVLEAACGTASISRMLVSKSYDVTAFDESEIMLETAMHASAEVLGDIRLYQHDAMVPFFGEYDVVLLPYDVLNHLKDFRDMKRLVNLMQARLNAGGIFMTDFLTEQGLKSLIGHKETFKRDTTSCHWTIEAFDADATAVKHRIVCNDKEATMVVKAYPLKQMMQLFQSLNVIETIDLEERRIVVCKH